MNRTFRNLTAATALAAVAATGVLTISNVAGAQDSTTQTAPENGAANPNRARVPLTAAERQCLTDQGLTRPETKPTAEQRQAARAAFDACGIEHPVARARAGRFVRNLTQEQRDCLKAELGVPAGEGQRPRLGTPEARQALQDAAGACGITLPARPNQPAS
ncbi:MAG: hypothetical protein ACKV2O_15380 [Acidimicrobiales bacterium]